MAALPTNAASPTAEPPTNRVPARYRELCSSSDITQISDTMWEVTGGRSLEVFLTMTGPSEISGCNLIVSKPFGITAGAASDVTKQAHSSSRLSGATVYEKHKLTDVFTLTSAGAERLAQIKRRGYQDPVVVRGTLYCSGRPSTSSKHSLAVRGHNGPNCQRACGGLGKCVSGCSNSSSLGHCCQYHLKLTMKLSQVELNKVTVCSVKSHTPAAIPWIPCHPRSLKTSALVIDDLVHDGILYNKTATSIVNTQAGECGRGGKGRGRGRVVSIIQDSSSL